MTEKHKSQYRDQDAQDNQEVVTPPELVDHIYRKCLETDPDFFSGKVLDPCVGPGALVRPILEKYQTDDDLETTELTVMDIQDMHIDNFKKGLVTLKKEKAEAAETTEVDYSKLTDQDFMDTVKENLINEFRR